MRGGGAAKNCDHTGYSDELDHGVAGGARRPPAPSVPAVSIFSPRYSDFAAVTVISGFIFKKLFSPMPRTFIRSSTFLNPPFFCRYSRMRSAVVFPIPVSVSSCATVSVFVLIVPADAGAAAFAAGRADSCAVTPAVSGPKYRTIAVIIRIMCCLLSVPGRPRPARRKRAELKGTVRVDLPHGSLRERAPDEHDG